MNIYSIKLDSPINPTFFQKKKSRKRSKMSLVTKSEVACLVHSWLINEGYKKSAQIFIEEAKHLFIKMNKVV